MLQHKCVDFFFSFFFLIDTDDITAQTPIDGALVPGPSGQASQRRVLKIDRGGA